MNDLLKLLGDSAKIPQNMLYMLEINKECNFNITLNVINKEIKLKNLDLEVAKKKLIDILPKLVQYERVQMRKILKDKEDCE